MITTTAYANTYQDFLALAKTAQGADQIRYAKKAVAKALVLNDINHITDATFLLVTAYTKQYKFKTGQYHLMKFKTDFESRLSDLQRYNLYYNLTYIQLDLEEWSSALLSAFSALKLYSQQNNKLGLYNNIAIAFSKLGKPDKSIGYLRKALSFANESANPNHTCSCLISLAGNFGQQNKIDEAQAYFEQAKLVAQTHQLHYHEAIILSNLANCYAYKEDWDTVIAHIKRSINISQKEGYIALFFSEKCHLASSYFKIGNYELAKYFLDEILCNKAIHNHPLVFQEVLDLKKSLLAEEKDFEGAYACLVQLKELEEERFEGSRNNKITQLIEQQEVEISLLEERNQQIDQQRQRLHQHNKELEQFAFIVANDLREPLQRIKHSTDLLLEDVAQKQCSAEQKNYTKHISYSVLHMDNLLNDLLVYTNIQHKTNEANTAAYVRVALEKVQTDLGQIIAHSGTKMYLSQMLSQPIAISPQHLYLLFKNLLHNAIKFRKSNATHEVRIKMTPQTNEQTCLFEIQDNGIGMAEEYQAQIFKIFNRLDKQNYKGTGIGLAICEKIVQLYGGKIWVTAAAGIGATFHFTLPLK